MGTIIHNTLIVTSFDEKVIEDAYDIAKELFHQTSEIFRSPCNIYFTFFVPTTGSKLGWPEYEKFQDSQEEFCKEIKNLENWSYLTVIKVSYGECLPFASELLV